MNKGKMQNHDLLKTEKKKRTSAFRNHTGQETKAVRGRATGILGKIYKIFQKALGSFSLRLHCEQCVKDFKGFAVEIENRGSAIHYHRTAARSSARSFVMNYKGHRRGL